MPKNFAINRVAFSLTLLITVTAYNSHSKRGLSWPNGKWVPIGGFTNSASQVSSYYNWNAEPTLPTSTLQAWDIPFPFIPMLWGCSESHISSFRAAMDSNWRGKGLTPDKAILGFNEPNIRDQANCSPQQAADVWRRVLQPLKREGCRIGAPAVTNGPDGRVWLDQWWAACQGGCDPDFMTVHWYDLDVGRFINYVKDFHNSYGRPIWVTEYAPTNFTFSSTGALIGTQATFPQIQRFMDVTNAWMDGTEWVERYFWFGAMYEMQGVNDLCSLLDPAGKPARTGALSQLGVQYAGANGSIAGASQPSSRPRWESGGRRRVWRGVGITLFAILGLLLGITA